MTASQTMIEFSSLALAPEMLQAIREMGYETPTPIQAESIPPLLEGRDLLGQAQTGTGKTAAFALPLLSRLDCKQKLPQILVLAPTRELALQVAEAFKSYASHLSSFHVLPLYGGQSIGLQLRQLKRNPQVIVGTPGRVMDHLRRNSLTLDNLSTLVLDEADEMLNMGFIEDIEWIFDQAPEDRQVALFSATMPEAIRRIARKQLRNPIEIKVRNKTETVTTIDQSHCVVTRHHKMDALTRLLEVEPFDGMIIFVRTKTATVEVADKLEAHGFAAEALNGDMNQAMRERTVSRLKSGQLDIIVATDVAARGLDVERISHVVNFDIPNDPESYVHRIGRTGRAGRTGKALLFVQPRERGLLKAIERTTRQPIPAINLPTADDLSEHRIDRFVEMLRETLSEQDLDFYYRLVSRIEKEQETSALDIAAALTFLSQKARPFIVDELENPDRKGRREKREKPGKDKRSQKKSRSRDNAIPFETYRLEVGEKDEVSPREIVGAIANEAGLDGDMIGRVEINKDHSLVELPVGMPKEIYHHLRRVYVRGQKLDLSLLNADAPAARKEKKKGKGKKRHQKSNPGKSRK
ncbi:MAG: DEAD/DEAH box helicase [Candidatus Thiodiazotropha sp. (ex Monitilora ramsayi)]|nr:DEAD/DEAH box helicase [Candidatus Thiodiazotropha sp. (ex Monitilora ramsayi)]